MMKNFSGSVAAVAAVMASVALLLVAVSPVAKAQAQTCNVTELSSCFPAYLGSTPSDTCCQKLNQQAPCFCDYAQDPTLSNFVNSTAARNIATSCNVTYPTNCS
ncbi:hypothetical protein PIB30_079900 [Stylosanthes scabra]|uniref:Bifunctional inhibitor/plant lipid transfer protein/seed storage helical domain-containing protein n=1 Tax=Stylosanthes scabra TaxID=79078 RepID=A0ABU6TQV1_9FABA|nr:hypothetical protein [Stylosanthes scabra]